MPPKKSTSKEIKTPAALRSRSTTRSMAIPAIPLAKEKSSAEMPKKPVKNKVSPVRASNTKQAALIKKRLVSKSVDQV